jgi:hypothetical protein
MTDAATKVLEETRRFEVDLPTLMKTFPGKWVIYMDGNVQETHETEEEAYSSALKRFGLHAGYIIIRVEPILPVPLTAGIIFGMVA